VALLPPRAARRGAGTVGAAPAVTVLKPLKGRASTSTRTSPASAARLPGLQIVFGVEDASDPAVRIVQRIRRDFPHVDVVLAVATPPGTNRKVANLRQMMRHARHDVLVMSDSDIRVRRDYLRALVAPLADPHVGLTTCLYRGARRSASRRSSSRCSSTRTSCRWCSRADRQRFEYAYGASIAVKREVLDAIGGSRRSPTTSRRLQLGKPGREGRLRAGAPPVRRRDGARLVTLGTCGAPAAVGTDVSGLRAGGMVLLDPDHCRTTILPALSFHGIPPAACIADIPATRG